MVKQLYEEGMKVICISKEYDYIFPSNILTFQGDIFDDNFLEDAISNILEEVGGIDVLINNIGYGVNSLMENQTEEELENMFRLNVASHLRMVKRCVNLGNLKRVINIASTYAKVTFPTLEVYAATKRATLMLTRSLAKELDNISFACICPGYMIHKKHITYFSSEAGRNFLKYRIPLQRVGNPLKELVPIVVLCATTLNEIKYVELFVDGGLSAYVGEENEYESRIYY